MDLGDQPLISIASIACWAIWLARRCISRRRSSMVHPQGVRSDDLQPRCLDLPSRHQRISNPGEDRRGAAGPVESWRVDSAQGRTPRSSGRVHSRCRAGDQQRSERRHRERWRARARSRAGARRTIVVDRASRTGPPRAIQRQLRSSRLRCFRFKISSGQTARL